MCQHPNMSLASGTVTTRTNLATIPRMTATTLGGYSTTQTLAAVTGLGGPPGMGITTAVRVSYTAGALNPGAVVMVGPASSTLYTVSAWVFNEGTVNEDIAIALKGQASGGQQTVAPGVWTKLSWTMTSAAGLVTGNDFGVRIGTAAGTGSFLVTAALVEQSGYVGTYFDGTTAAANSLTYAWTGTANASTSTETAPGISGWTPSWYGANGGSGVTFQSTDTPIDGPFMRKLWKTANIAPNSDLGWRISTRLNVTVGKTYSVSGTFRSSVAQHIAIWAAWYDAGGVLLSTGATTDLGALVPNAWQRFSVLTAAAPANAATAYFFLTVGTGSIAMPAGSTLDLDQVLIEEAPNLSTAGAFFSGNFPAAGDFTYSWSGTVNASSSLQKAVIPLKVGWLNATPVSSADWSASGTKSVRVVPASSSADSFAYLTIPVLENKTYTLLATLRMTAAQTGIIDARARRLMMFHSNGYTQSAQAPNAAGITQLAVTFTVTDVSQYQNARLYNGAQLGGGDVWFDNIMLVEGTYAGDYINPSQNLLAKWDGTVNDSTSIGYPPQLLDIAGKPVLDLAGVSSGGVAIPVPDPFGPRTIYLCYDATGQAVNYPSYGSYGVAGTKGVTFQAGPIGATSLFPRFDLPGGSINFGVTLSGGRNTRRHVAAVSVVQGLTAAKCMMDGGAERTDALTPGTTGWDDGRGTAATASVDGSGLRMLVYNADHDAATKQAISRYLGNKYGAAVS